MKIKRGDTVKITKGKDRNKTGKVLKVFPEERKILIEGLNLYKKHARPRRRGEKGEVVQVAKPISVSNVVLVCKKCGKTSKTGSRFEGDRKVRYCKSCGEENE